MSVCVCVCLSAVPSHLCDPGGRPAGGRAGGAVSSRLHPVEGVCVRDGRLRLGVVSVWSGRAQVRRLMMEAVAPCWAEEALQAVDGVEVMEGGATGHLTDQSDSSMSQPLHFVSCDVFNPGSKTLNVDPC